MSSAIQILQEQRWQAWHARAIKTHKAEGGQRHYTWPSFREKAMNAELGTIALGALGGLALAYAIMLTTMTASSGHNTDCLGFKIGTGIAAFSFVAPICITYRCVMKHRREIREDTDDHGNDLHKRTLRIDQDPASKSQTKNKSIN